MKTTPSTFFKTYEEMVLKDPAGFWQGYQEALAKVADSPAQYKGKPVEFLFQPFFLTLEQWSDLEKITEKMGMLIHKVTQQYLKNPKFRAYFDFDPLMETLILKKPGYSQEMPMARMDVFYHFDGRFQFCEINTDGSSGMTECRELQRIIRNSPAVELLPVAEGDISEGEFFESWVSSFLENYWEFSGGNTPPNVAIVDWFQSEIASEFVEFQKVFEEKNCPARIVDVRQLTYQNGKLMAGDFHIDAVYRRIVSWELVERYPETKALIDAYLAGDVCVVGPIRSQIPHNKRFFAVLHQEEATDFLNREEKEFIRQHIPYTAILSKDHLEQWDQWANHKNEYIIKPEDWYASSGVYAGKDYDLQQWKNMLEQYAGKDYLIQRYCDVPHMPMAMFREGEAWFEDQQYLMGCFVYNQRFQGPYIRTGRKSIIGSVVECYTVPAYLLVNQTQD